MSYTNFKPQVWSRFVLHALEMETQLRRDCWDKFTGEARQGSTVHIQGISPITVKKYKVGEDIDSPETQDGSTTPLLIDQYDYTNFAVDDVDDYQANIDLMKELMIENSRSLAQTADSYIASLAKGAKYSSASLAIATAAAAKKAIDDGIQQLRENNVPISDTVVIEIPAFVYRYLRDSLVDIKTNNDSLIKKGVVGMYDNCTVKLCNNLYDDGTDIYAMIRTKRAIAYASGVDKMEAYRPEKSFSDAIKCLHVYGAKLVCPEELYVVKCHK